MPARWRDADHDSVAFRQVCHAGANGRDDTCPLMSADGRAVQMASTKGADLRSADSAQADINAHRPVWRRRGCEVPEFQLPSTGDQRGGDPLGTHRLGSVRGAVATRAAAAPAMRPNVTQLA